MSQGDLDLMGMKECFLTLKKKKKEFEVKLTVKCRPTREKCLERHFIV